jgi:O-antigen/teichoic acid export membrane protein
MAGGIPDEEHPTGLMRHARDRLRPRELGALTAEGRGRERYRRIGLTAGASMAARAVSIVASLVSVPLTVHYLGTEQYGLWVTITALSALLGFADFGLSNGLMNAVSDAHGRDDRAGAQGYVSSAVAMLAIVALVLGVAFALAYPLVPWDRVFNVTSEPAAAVAGRAFAVFVSITLASIPLGVVASIQLGYQEGYRNGAWQAAGSVFSLVGLVVAVAAEAPLPWLVLAIGSGPLLATVLNAAGLLRRRPWLSPRRRSATMSAARWLLRLGLLFFILQLAYVVAYQTDYIVIGQILGPSAVTTYAIPMKLFMTIPMLLGFGLLPLWPAYREALTRRDLPWVRRTLVRSLEVTAAVSIPLSLILVVFGRPLIEAWVGDEVVPTTGLLVALGLWMVVYSVSVAIAMFLNGANVIGFQAGLAIAMMVTNLALSILLTHLIGVSGPAWGSTIALVTCVLLPCTWYLRRLLRTLGDERPRGTAAPPDMIPPPVPENPRRHP